MQRQSTIADLQLEGQVVSYSRNQISELMDWIPHQATRLLTFCPTTPSRNGVRDRASRHSRANHRILTKKDACPGQLLVADPNAFITMPISRDSCVYLEQKRPRLM